MPVIKSKIDIHSDSFKQNSKDMHALIDAFRAKEAALKDNSNKKKARFEKRNQLLPRKRLALVLDRGAAFLELSPLAGIGMHDDDGNADIMGGGVIIGIGYVSGVRCLVCVHDSAIKGGAISPMGLKKTLRAQEVALLNKLPIVTLAESAGANLTYQSEIFVDGGRIFANQAKLSAAGIPQITVVHGSSTAGGAIFRGYLTM